MAKLVAARRGLKSIANRRGSLPWNILGFAAGDPMEGIRAFRGNRKAEFKQ
jgi:hypothetical protein